MRVFDSKVRLRLYEARTSVVSEPVAFDSGLYVPPIGNGEGRLCSNCFMWIQKDRCAIHREDQPIKGGQVCSYHVYGTPKEEWTTLGVEQPLTPKLSGLIDAPEGGTRCGQCEWYRGGSGQGLCRRLSQDGRPAQVHHDGCCAMWED